MNGQSADLFDGLTGENPPWGMTGGSRRRRSRMLQKVYADHYKLNGRGKSCRVRLRCRGAIWGNPKSQRMSAEVIRLRRTAMRLVPAAGRLFEGTKQMRDGSNRDLNVGIGGCVSWLSTCSVTFRA
jgi:hypothetical protein